MEAKNGNKMQMEIKCKCISNFELIEERGSHRKFVGELFTWTMKPPHCLTQKCQKFSQFASSWTLASKTTLNDSHQQ